MDAGVASLDRHTWNVGEPLCPVRPLSFSSRVVDRSERNCLGQSHNHFDGVKTVLHSVRQKTRRETWGRLNHPPKHLGVWKGELGALG
jgi:hypothetical protein